MGEAMTMKETMQGILTREDQLIKDLFEALREIEGTLLGQGDLVAVVPEKREDDPAFMSILNDHRERLEVILRIATRVMGTLR